VKDGEKCPCGFGTIRAAKTKFSLTARVMEGGPFKGEVMFTAVPEGLDTWKCDAEICGEEFIDGRLAAHLDGATTFLRQTEPSLESYLALAKQQLDHWVKNHRV